MSAEGLSHPVHRFILILTSQGGIFAGLVILPICVVNALPFLAFLFPLSKRWRRVLLAAVISIDAAVIAIATYLMREMIYSIKYDTWMHLAIIRRGIEN